MKNENEISCLPKLIPRNTTQTVLLTTVALSFNSFNSFNSVLVNKILILRENWNLSLLCDLKKNPLKFKRILLH